MQESIYAAAMPLQQNQVEMPTSPTRVFSIPGLLTTTVSCRHASLRKFGWLTLKESVTTHVVFEEHSLPQLIASNRVVLESLSGTWMSSLSPHVFCSVKFAYYRQTSSRLPTKLHT